MSVDRYVFVTGKWSPSSNAASEVKEVEVNS
jgi:hypothetical protein